MAGNQEVGVLKINTRNKQITQEKLYVEAYANIEQLNEILIVEKKEPTREGRVKSNGFGRVEFFDENDSDRYFDLASFIRSAGFIVNETAGTFQIINCRGCSFAGTREPAVYIDDFLKFDSNQLNTFDMGIIDYIETNKNGLGGSFNDATGSVKIYRDPLKKANLILQIAHWPPTRPR